MFKIPLADLKQKLLQSGKITSEALEVKIKQKINELSGLISEEGAAHIIANELGVPLVNPEGKLKIKELYPGMRNIHAVGKVIRKFELRSFQKGELTGKVASLQLGDESGTVRLVLWHEQTTVFPQITEGDIVAIRSGMVKENNMGYKEIHLNERASLTINPPGETVETVRESFTTQRKKITELQGGETNIEVFGTIIQVFDPYFFSVCPQCNKRVTERDGGSSCPEHGNVTAASSYVTNVVLDDGSGYIRTVFWKNQTNNLVRRGEDSMALYRTNPQAFDDVKTDLLGEQIKVIGRVLRNTLFDRLELNAQMVFFANPDEEIARLEPASQLSN